MEARVQLSAAVQWSFVRSICNAAVNALFPLKADERDYNTTRNLELSGFDAIGTKTPGSEHSLPARAV